MNDLGQLFRDATVGEPPDHLDLVTVVRVGGNRRRRRRATTVVAASLATAAVVALGTAVVARTPDTASTPATDGTTGPVITLGDAVPAVEGTDYRVLTTRESDATGDERFVGVTDDGLGVVMHAGMARKDVTPIGLVDPADGTTRWLPGGPQRIDDTATIALGEDRLVFQESRWSARQPAVRVFDRRTETWSTISWPDLPRAQLYYPTVHGGRLYLALDIQPSNDGFDLWSVSLDDSADVRDEHRPVLGSLDVTGDELTWTDGSSGEAARVHVRDLSTGEERSVDPHLGEGCGVVSMVRVGDRLLLGQVCGGHDDRLQVVTMDGHPVVTVDDAKVGANIGDGGRVAVVAGGEGGPYVLDPVTGELWQVGSRMALWSSPEPVPDGSDFALWTTTDWFPDGGPGPVEPGPDDDPTYTDHLVEWLS
jgi:hypothetical protein